MRILRTLLRRPCILHLQRNFRRSLGITRCRLGCVSKIQLIQQFLHPRGIDAFDHDIRASRAGGGASVRDAFPAALGLSERGVILESG